MKKRFLFNIALILMIGPLTSTSAIAKEILFKANCRHRPPEMVYNEETKKCEGPLIDILDQAIKKIDGTVEWERRPFQKSYTDLKRGKIDILPRVIKTDEREKEIKFFSPIGFQNKSIVFAVKKGHENDIKTFDDLLKYRIGTKRGTSYFKRFNDTANIYKIFAIDDSDLSKRFIRGRCDAVILLDIKAFEKMMKEMKYEDYAYAKYEYINKIGNHFAMSLKTKHINLFNKIDNELMKMTDSGQIKNIYLKYKLKPPSMGETTSKKK